jgi:hypothetical protein
MLYRLKHKDVCVFCITGTHLPISRDPYSYIMQANSLKPRHAVHVQMITQEMANIFVTNTIDQRHVMFSLCVRRLSLTLH